MSIVNFMNETSYELFNPIRRLMMPLLSGFLGQPKYYMPDQNTTKQPQSRDRSKIRLESYLLTPKYGGMSSQEVFYIAACEALDYDFGKTLELAVRSRNEWFMRQSTAQLLAIAASHPQRINFNKENPTIFRNTVVKCCLLPNDMISILDAWKALHGSKAKFPSFMKRAFEDRLSELTTYHAGKYTKSTIDSIRISHLKKGKQNSYISPIMNTGSIELSDQEITWEKHRSQGKNWTETYEAMGHRVPHMAALRNICSVARSDPGEEFMKEWCDMVVSGVKGGKQFPFRYISAKRQFEISIQPQQHDSKVKPISVKYVQIVENCFEKCLQESIENFPKLEGSIVALSDNSGSAHGTFTSSYGSQTVADIGNLSALITALSCTGRGVVGLFGDKLIEYEVSKDRPLLEQYNEISTIGKTVGQSTENGVWLFFKRAFQDHTKYNFDYFFCYSDMQVGHGGLYGDDIEIKKGGWSCNYGQRESQHYINILSLFEHYRKTINYKMNTFMVQTAGYVDSILPETTYRGAIMSGWTGNEVIYAKEYTKLWDELEGI